MQRLRVIDSHTGGEPTRVVIEGMPDLGSESIVDRLETLRRDHDPYRRAVICEPRSPAFAVGAYLLPSQSADFGVVFFNNVGYLGMCGHGTIGVVTTLKHLGMIRPGVVRFETPVGLVTATLHADGLVSFDNVPAYRYRDQVAVDVSGHKAIHGDVAYGGNWFFITDEHGMSAESDRGDLLVRAIDIRSGLAQAGITGDKGAEIDHVELVWAIGPMTSKNFVLCPGREYDRSPCGTGTSAKLACLFEDGKLREDEEYRVESIIGSSFHGSIRRDGEKLIPTISGRAYVNSETTIMIDPEDPFAWGIS